MTKRRYQMIDGKLNEIGDEKSTGWYCTATYAMPIVNFRPCFKLTLTRPADITDAEWDDMLAQINRAVDEENAKLEADAQNTLNSNVDDE